MKLLLAFYSFIEFDNTSYNNSYTISVLLINNIKYYGTILNLVGKKGKVYLINYNKKEVLKILLINKLSFLSYLLI